MRVGPETVTREPAPLVCVADVGGNGPGASPRGAGEDWGLCEHTFVTSQGHLPALYARACEQGNYKLAAALAAQLKPLSLAEALNLLPLIADNEPLRFEAAAARWLGRWLLERPGPDLASSLLVLAALGALRGPRRSEGLRLLRGLV
jgi:hypothetical protein